MIKLRTDRIEELVREALKRDGASVEKLARLVDITPSYLWKLRHGDVPNVSAVVIGRLAEALGVSVDYLLGIGRDELGLPVAEAALAPLVVRLNELDPGDREQVRAIVESILDYGTGSRRSVDVRSPNRRAADRLLDGMSDEQLAGVLDDLLKLAGEEDEGSGQASA